MTEKKCSDCEYLERDGFAGIWCGVGGNNKNYNCRKFKRKKRPKTEEQLKKEIDGLKLENEDLNEELMGYDSFISLYKKQRDELKEKNQFLSRKKKEMEHEIMYWYEMFSNYKQTVVNTLNGHYNFFKNADSFPEHEKIVALLVLEAIAVKLEVDLKELKE